LLHLAGEGEKLFEKSLSPSPAPPTSFQKLSEKGILQQKNGVLFS